MENFKKTIEANTTGPDSNGTWCPEWELKRTRWNTFSPPHVITSLSIRQEVNISSNHCPWCIGKTQNESELLLARGALLHLITWLWIYRIYIYAVYTPCSFWRIPRPNLSHTCAMDATLAYPCGGFVNLWCVSSNSLTDAWLLMSIYHHCWENLREHLWLRQGTNLSQSFDLKFKQSLVLGPYRRGEKKTSQEEHLESLVK